MDKQFVSGPTRQTPSQTSHLWRSSSSSALHQEDPLTTLNLAALESSQAAGGGGVLPGRRCVTPRQGNSAKRGSLADACSRLQEGYATPRALEAYKDAPVGLCFDPETTEQIYAMERLNWLVRWTYRHHSLFAASPGDNQSAADTPKLAKMRIRLNTTLLVYTVFGGTVMRTDHSARRGSGHTVRAAPSSHTSANQLALDHSDMEQETTPVPTPRLQKKTSNAVADGGDDDGDGDGGGGAGGGFINLGGDGKRSDKDSELELSISEAASSVSHTSRLREAARRQLEPFVTEAKNGPGPSDSHAEHGSVVPNDVNCGINESVSAH